MTGPSGWQRNVWALALSVFIAFVGFQFFSPFLPLYVREGKSYLTIAVGCTGGRHRSVVLAEELGRRVGAWGYTVHLRHRDLKR